MGSRYEDIGGSFCCLVLLLIFGPMGTGLSFYFYLKHASGITAAKSFSTHRNEQSDFFRLLRISGWIICLWSDYNPKQKKKKDRACIYSAFSMVYSKLL